MKDNIQESKKRGKIIGVTGGIGSGKSLAMEILKNEGYFILSADDASREVLKDESILDLLKEVFGREIIDVDGKLNRTALGKIIFSDIKSKQVLESILIPRIFEYLMDKTEEYQSRNPNKDVFIEAPTLFETKLDKKMDAVLLITASMDIRISRGMKRDGASREEILARIKNQMSEEEKISRSDYVIFNDGSVEELKERLYKYLLTIR